ncbi:MAG: hypothetical protein LBE02_07340 [Spirochaetaceae bacterium]|jgi:hypothetical protein|nr:hypothetical protein [Spirochaetaceae bacterium]
MVDRLLIDTLNLQAKEFAARWKGLIRRSPQLKHYAALDDESLVRMNFGFYPLLARTLDRGLNRRELGDFFVHLGKERMKEGFPISELIYAVNLVQQTVISYIMTDFGVDSPLRMYQSMGILNKVAEFFLLGCFYLTKGFLESTYTNMKSKNAVNEDILKQYFKDDFFFKKDEDER